MEQRPIGVIGAMKIEVDAILSALEEAQEKVHGNMVFTSGRLSGVPVVVAQCSPGKVNAALCTQALIDFYAPRLVLNIGVAGGIGENVHIGDVVIATACVEYDFDTSAPTSARPARCPSLARKGRWTSSPVTKLRPTSWRLPGKGCTAMPTGAWWPPATSLWRTPRWGSGSRRSLAPWLAKWKAAPLPTPAW